MAGRGDSQFPRPGQESLPARSPAPRQLGPVHAKTFPQMLQKPQAIKFRNLAGAPQPGTQR